jgi:hypothetical protein
MNRKVILFSLLTVSLFGCGSMKDNVKTSYEAPSVIMPADIKTLSVKPFENETSESGINSKLWLATTDEFIRDGRIRYVDKEESADGVVIGTIKQFRETEFSHDVNLVAKEYQIWVVMDLKFLDRAKNQYLWQESNLEQKFRYLTETQPGGMTKEQAKEELWQRFAQDIVKRTIDGFGSVTGSSSKAIPKEPMPDNPPPAYPSTAPF